MEGLGVHLSVNKVPDFCVLIGKSEAKLYKVSLECCSYIRMSVAEERDWEIDEQNTSSDLNQQV